MTQPTTLRPENRQRSSQAGPPWADTVPLCFRSEAFAEDLCHGEEGARLATGASCGARWRGHGNAPLLGLALAAVRGVLAR